MENNTQNNVLEHHGIKGMKWGVRRTPAQLGYKPKSISDKAKARAKAIEARAKNKAKKLKEETKYKAKIAEAEERAKAKLAKAEAKAQAKIEKARIKGNPDLAKKDDDNNSKPDDISKKKSIKDMTDDEIRARINRIQLERQLDSLTPKEVSKGKAFMTAVGKDVLAPAAISAGKELMTKFIKSKGAELLGVKEVKDAMSELEKEAKIAGFKKQIAESEKAQRDNRNAKQAEIDAANRARQAEIDAANQAKQAKADAKAAKKAEKQASKEKHDDWKKRMKVADAAADDIYDMSKTDLFNQSPLSVKNVARNKSQYDNVIDMVADEPVSSVTSNSSYSLGQSYVNRLMLEDK